MGITFTFALSGCGNAAAKSTAAVDNISLETSVSGNSVSENSAVADGLSAGVSGNGMNESEGLEAGSWEEQKERVKVKGIYVTGPMAGTAGMDSLISLVEETELNAMVIDIKNDDGRITYEMDSELVSGIGAAKGYVKDMPALVAKCKEKGIYLIARVVAFKDPYLAEKKPELSLHTADGAVFRDRNGLAWVNPYKKEVWDYLVEVALQAGEVGFDEVQFDYIRFATDKGMKNVDFGPEAAEKSKADIITEFTAYAAKALQEQGLFVSADVYGTIIDSEIDAQIVGQNYVEMAEHFDYLCPMVYPSHYGPYNYGIPVPDADPYRTILSAMQASRKVLAGLPGREEASLDAEGAASDENNAGVSGNDVSVSGNSVSVSGNSVSGNSVSDNADSGEAVSDNANIEEINPAELEPMESIRAGVRPWLQDFTAKWVKGYIPYGAKEIRAQIQAVYDAGYEEWILWNAANRYTRDGLLSAEEAEAESREAEQSEAGIDKTESSGQNAAMPAEENVFEKDAE